ncbi:MAG: MerC domain-containing protein [Woeseiaceae bacterium]
MTEAMSQRLRNGDKADREAARDLLLDRTAVALSGLCLLHCLALPFLVGALPFVSIAGFGDGHFHLQMLLIVIPVSVIAFALGFRRHARVGIPAWGALGLALLIVGATYAHDRLGSVADGLLTVSGALVLAVAHFRNSRQARHRALPSSD